MTTRIRRTARPMSASAGLARAATGALGRRSLLRLPLGTIGIRETGSGQPVLFIPGLVVNGLAWRHVVSELADRARCIAPDWPLGSHSPAMPAADLTPPGLARIVTGVLDALGLERAVLVGNGYGGDIAQMVAAHHPDRVSGLVLIACNAFDSDPWPTKAVRWLSRPPGAGVVQARLLWSRRVQRLPFNYGWATKRPIPDEIMASYLAPFRKDPAVRRDFHRLLRTFTPEHLTRASAMLANFERPALVVSPIEDRIFPIDGARRLAQTMPNARFATVADSYAWIPEDQPAQLARLLRDYLATLEEAAAPSHSHPGTDKEPDAENPELDR
jgi:pimeloyl-ACP methyl ester carboxylesterase